jgi:hypothetical protein
VTYPYQQAYPKRRRTWPWIVAAAAFVFCVVGAIAAIAGIGGTAAVIEKESESRAADINIGTCTKTIINTVEVNYTLTNSSSAGRSYMPEFRIVAWDKAILGSAHDFTPEVPAGSTYKGKAVGTIAEGAEKFTCELVGS